MDYNSQSATAFSTRNIGPSLNILQINVEGICQSKSDFLAKLAEAHRADVIVAQETPTVDELSLTRRGSVNGFTVAGATFHWHYGAATYVRDNIDNWLNVSTKTTGHDISCIETRVSNLTVVNIYKPPNAIWTQTALPKVSHPALSAGDFNSHHTQWGYRQIDENGELVTEWIGHENLCLCFDAKERGTFKSARWNTETNPDLCLVTKNSQGVPLHVTRKVLSVNNTRGEIEADEMSRHRQFRYKLKIFILKKRIHWQERY